MKIESPQRLLTCEIFPSGKPNETRYFNESFYEDQKMAPTIFVGAAHCNFICKDFTEPNYPVPLETCCCLPKDISPSCKKGSEVS